MGALRGEPPSAALRGWATCVVAAALLVSVGAGRAAAQTFTFGKPDEVAEVQDVTWSATAEGALLVTTGNAETVTGTLGARGTRVDPDNKIDASFALAYSRSTILIATDADASGTIGPDELSETTVTAANSWEGKLRYDRFLTGYDALFAAARIGVDVPAGKDRIAGAQVGYSRWLYKREHHEVVAELGYDFTYEDLAATGAESLEIHSIRGFVGYKAAVRGATGIEASVEALTNLNAEPGDIDRFEDFRLNGLVSLNTQLTDDISFSISFTAKYDHAPAPRAPIAPLRLPYDPGFVPLADTLDTITKASLIVTIL